jgi:hypothetical protein
LVSASMVLIRPHWGVVSCEVGTVFIEFRLFRI